MTQTPPPFAPADGRTRYPVSRVPAREVTLSIFLEPAGKVLSRTKEAVTWHKNSVHDSEKKKKKKHVRVAVALRTI